MYKLPYFREGDPGKVFEFMLDNSFAIIAGMGENFPVATHVPLDVKKQGATVAFTGHIMKGTDHHKAFEKNNKVLVIFNGPHCQVSANWYTNPVQASTWNYMTVHAKGKITFTDEPGTKKIVEELTDRYEGLEGRSAFKNLAPGYVDRLVKAIIGFTIEVESFDHVFKLSQNHEPETRLSIIRHLMENGSDNHAKIAEEMKFRIDP